MEGYSCGYLAPAYPGASTKGPDVIGYYFISLCFGDASSQAMAPN